MILRQHRGSAMQRFMLIGLLGLIGCDENERLAKYAQQSVEQQAKQNEQIARQSEAVAKQTQQIAEAANRIVDADAQARLELVAAQRELHLQLQVERSSLDRQHEALDQERQRVAEARQREPIIAAAIQALTITLACLLPLLLCAYALRQLARSQPDDEGLCELLVQELAAEEPRLLPGWGMRSPTIEHHPLPTETGLEDANPKGDDA